MLRWNMSEFFLRRKHSIDTTININLPIHTLFYSSKISCGASQRYKYAEKLSRTAAAHSVPEYLQRAQFHFLFYLCSLPTLYGAEHLRVHMKEPYLRVIIARNFSLTPFDIKIMRRGVCIT